MWKLHGQIDAAFQIDKRVCSLYKVLEERIVVVKYRMNTSRLADNPLEILRLRLEAGVKATPLCVAIMGWLCNVPTDPFVAAIRLHGGEVALRLSDEPALEPLCPLADFLDQVQVICHSIQFDTAQTNFILTRARHLLE